MTGTYAHGRRGICSGLPVLLAAAASVFLTVLPTPAGTVLVRQPQPAVIEISGGEGAAAWRLQYGTRHPFRVPFQIVTTGDLAYFSHGNWLRRIDTKRGVVTGRWRFPWNISRLEIEGSAVRVEIVNAPDLSRTFRQTLIFDPDNPKIPDWPGLDNFDLPITEASAPWRLALSGDHYAINLHIAPERARELIPEVEYMARHDPLSPWFQATLGVLLRTAGDPRADYVLGETARIPGLEYTELLRLSAFLMQVKLDQPAREAFERGYRDFWARGNDPRLMRSVWVRRSLFPPFGGNPEWLERAYRLAPYAQASTVAWRAYADQLAREGHADQARVWRQRAGDPRSLDRFFSMQRSLGVLAGVFLLIPAAILAAVVYIVVLFFRYRRQRLLDRAAGGSWMARRFVTLFRLEYTARRERAALVGMVLTLWLATGFAGGTINRLPYVWGSPQSLWQGTLAGPENTWFLENRLPATRERNLMLAVAYQQGGETDKAERLYRAMPGFAVSWNNLGVLLRNSGKEADAQAAFAKALEIEPGFPEALLNAKGTPSDFWTSEYARLLPGHPMLAPPRGEQFVTAFSGHSRPVRYLRAFAGPLLVQPPHGAQNFPIGPFRTGLLIALCGAFALLLLLPRLRVSAAPSRAVAVAEILLPGSSRRWLVLRGLVAGFLMTAWAWLLLLLVASNSREFRRPFASDVSFSYGVRAENAGSLLFWAVAAVALIFTVNLFLVLRSLRRSGDELSQA